MKPNCPQLKCQTNQNPSPDQRLVVRNGVFFRKSDSRYIRRYYCRSCKKHFSKSTLSPRYWQKKRRINPLLNNLLCSGVSQRRAAILLKVNRKTVVRRFRFLANQARLEHEEWLKRYSNQNLMLVQFDDLETSEHTKCKPLSISVAIDPIDRKVLNFKVSLMPAKGHLAKISIRKYGYRADLRKEGLSKLMSELKPYIHPTATWLSDDNPHYGKILSRLFPRSTHQTTKGGRGCITGQGELKKLKFDPLFMLNHTCAMLRANLNRLFRKTWCTTKTVAGLNDHLALFVPYFNKILTHSSAVLGAS